MEPEGAGPAGAKRRRAAPTMWTAKKRAAFFDHLSITGNITEAAAAAGVRPQSVHNLRLRDTAFADAWAVAIEAGYATIEMRLIGHVLAGLSQNDPLEPVGGAAAIDVVQAMRLLRERDTRRSGARSRSAAAPRRATMAETDAAILAKLAAIAARKNGA